jgi:hypothetical protein
MHIVLGTLIFLVGFLAAWMGLTYWSLREEVREVRDKQAAWEERWLSLEQLVGNRYSPAPDSMLGHVIALEQNVGKMQLEIFRTGS